MSEKRIALYSRVSTEIQVDRDSLANQEEQLLSYARKTDLSFELYRDAGVSAKNTERAAFQRMMEDVRAGKVSSVVVTKLDRISRNLKDLAILLDELRDREVDFICITQGIDISSPTGRLIYQVPGGLEEWGREMTAERVTEAMRIRAKRKLWNGGPTPYGYSHDAENKMLVLNEEEAPIARKIFKTFLEIGTFRGTADRMNREGYRTRSGYY